VRALRSLVVATAAALAVTGAGMGSALADPASTPPINSIVAVGSDTIQFVADSFSSSYNATSPAPANLFYSWDATNPSTGAIGDPINLKNDTNCDGTARPDGSGAGIAQLQKLIKTSTTFGGVNEYCVDVARSSRNIQPSDGTGLVSVLFAHDLITYSIVSGGNGVTNLTDTDLTAIYECNASLINSADSGPVTWNEVGGASTAAIQPVLPQSSSGTRAQWLLDIGVTTSTLGSCVTNGTYAGNLIEENEGTNAVFTSAGNANYKNVLFPYSGGAFVCQSTTANCGAKGTVEGSLVLEDIDGKAPLTTATPPVINVTGLSAFPAKYIRGLYFVAKNGNTASSPEVPTPSTPDPWPIDLTPLLGQGNTSGWICGTAAGTIIKSFGFATVSNCGALTGQ
jgi:ABC-type phosphate transport system substrate-binding protein